MPGCTVRCFNRPKDRILGYIGPDLLFFQFPPHYTGERYHVSRCGNMGQISDG